MGESRIERKREQDIEEERAG
jgi:hypothetical protein